MDEKCAVVDDNLYRYPLSKISQRDNDLSFLDDDHEDKECSDPLSCYLSSLSNEDELCWFSSSHATEVSKDALRSGKRFVGHMASALKISVCEVSQPKSVVCAGIPINDSNRKIFSIGDRTKPQTSHNDNPDTLGLLLPVKAADMTTESRVGIT